MNESIHPVVAGEPRSLPPLEVEAPFTLVIFGASGDLTRRKLVPALYAMYEGGMLRQAFSIIGVARRDYDDEVFRGMMLAALREHSRADFDEGRARKFLGHLFYHRGDLTDPDSYRALKERCDDPDTHPANKVHYLAISPGLFGPVVEMLKASGLTTPPFSSPWTRVVIEKPFGTDYESARALNRAILTHIDESQVYRIDHYLGKETVQNILSFRFANSIFEPIFNNHYVEHIQITAAETVGMESGRGAYYDAAGAMRDMVQNHLLQLLCLVGMEPPSGLAADSVRNEKVDLLQSVVPMAPADVATHAVRGQYTAGRVGGVDVPGYRDEDRVPRDSRTASYVALRLAVENWRWAGVPILLRTGKRMSARLTEIAIQFKMPPLQLFRTVQCEGDVCDLTMAQPNVLVFHIQPGEGISLRFAAKRPAMQFVVESVAMDFSYQETWTKRLPEAYERLLIDALRGDSTLFTRSDEVEAAWRIVDPVLKTWEQQPEIPVCEYPAGTWGPAEANGLFKGLTGEWRNG